MALFEKKYSTWSKSNGGFSRDGDKVNEVRLVGVDSAKEMFPNGEDQRLRYERQIDTSDWPLQRTHVTIEIRDASVLPIEIKGITFDNYYTSGGYDSGGQIGFIDTIACDATGTITCTRRSW